MMGKLMRKIFFGQLRAAETEVSFVISNTKFTFSNIFKSIKSSDVINVLK